MISAALLGTVAAAGKGDFFSGATEYLEVFEYPGWDDTFDTAANPAPDFDSGTIYLEVFEPPDWDDP